MNGLTKRYLLRALAMDSERDPEIQAAVEKKVKAGKCILGNCTNDCTSRGLCDKHRQLFYLRRRQKPEAERIQYEADAIRLGRILDADEQRLIQRVDPFVDAG